MPVLLMARGDAAAKDMLRKTIEARYSFRPPVIESLILGLKGRVHTKVGPLNTGVPVEIFSRFQFPTSVRWDYVVRAAHVTVKRGTVAYDGTRLFRASSSNLPTVIDDENVVNSTRARLWAAAAVLLTPLGEYFVELKSIDERTLQATNTQNGNTVKLNLRADYHLESVQMECINPETDEQEPYSLRLSDDQIEINDLILPAHISAWWGDKPEFEVEPVGVEMNTQISSSLFTLAAAAS